MLLFKKQFWAGLQDGRTTLTFRRWRSPHVRAGGRYRCHPIGVLEVDDVRLVPCSSITDAEARRAGFDSRRELLEYLRELGPVRANTQIYRVELHYGGDGDRVELALVDELDDAALEDIRKRLARMDREQPWTAATMALIAERPRVAASKLAAALGRDARSFKIDVRKLKRIGLTQSFEVGYEISPRGRAYLNAVGAAPVANAGRAAARLRRGA